MSCCGRNGEVAAGPPVRRGGEESLGWRSPSLIVEDPSLDTVVAGGFSPSAREDVTHTAENASYHLFPSSDLISGLFARRRTTDLDNRWSIITRGYAISMIDRSTNERPTDRVSRKTQFMNARVTRFTLRLKADLRCSGVKQDNTTVQNCPTDRWLS